MRNCPALRLLGLRLGWPRSGGGAGQQGSSFWCRCLPWLQSTSLTRALKAIYLDADKPSHVKNGRGPREALPGGSGGNYKFNAFSIIAGACACPGGRRWEGVGSMEDHQRVSVMISGRQWISASTRTKLWLYWLILSSACWPARPSLLGIILLGLIIAGSFWPLSRTGCNLIYRCCLTLSGRQ